MEKWADLHIHTFYSDSTSSPEEVLKQARDCDISCIAITDHDTIAGIAPTQQLSVEYGIEVITGIEFSSELNGRDIHILGYLFDPNHPILLKQLEHIQDMRIDRMKKMILRLKEMNVADIDFDEVAALTKSRSVGRLHLATILLKYGKVATIKQAFDKYLADSAPVYVADLKPTPFEIIKLIHQAGGISVLAHPMIANIDELIPQFVEAGLRGIEVYYPNTAEVVIEHYAGIAQKHQLYVTGGSDAHGSVKKNTFIGRLKIPYELVEKLKSFRS